MKYFRIATLVLFLMPLSAIACGPSPQKVTKEIVIKAEPAKIWALLSDFGAMQKWHPGVVAVVVESKPDTNGKDALFRTLKLKSGGSLSEKQRETQSDEMKLGVVMLEGDFAVSNYSDAITIKPSTADGESLVTWVGRFNNKANAMQAPAGEDDATAIAAVNAFYGAGLQGLKSVLEKN